MNGKTSSYWLRTEQKRKESKYSNMFGRRPNTHTNCDDKKRKANLFEILISRFIDDEINS